MLIGLTGRNASGKGEVARCLEAKGFHYHSLSDVIREEVRSQGKELTRENLIATGNELRRRFGPAVLAERVLERLPEGAHGVIDSIRNPSEVMALRKTKSFRLIRIEAPVDLRFERAKTRQREKEAVSLERFIELETIELSGDTASQNLLAVEALADETLDNSGTLDELRARVDTLAARLLSRVPRPDWDRYFMDIATVVASRSNCMKRHVAAIIVRDKRVISTGYNGTPRGTRNCNEGGCPRCNNMAASGTQLDECLCSHGEENAIVQASYHGVSVKDAVIYSTFAPCLMCAKMIINSGIREVVFNADYPLNDSAFRLFEEARIVVRRLPVQS
ncbi:MAG TPA: deaminase [Terriglobia bacterium]|nr:deaminase [Terriglobia bacterium]